MRKTFNEYQGVYKRKQGIGRNSCYTGKRRQAINELAKDLTKKPIFIKYCQNKKMEKLPQTKREYDMEYGNFNSRLNTNRKQKKNFNKQIGIQGKDNERTACMLFWQYPSRPVDNV